MENNNSVNTTEAEKLWSEIKDQHLNMFGLPNQLVSAHCKFANVEPSKLYLTIKSGATLTALESALAGKYSVELVDKYVVIKRVAKVG